jgi:hypothetical protein
VGLESMLSSPPAASATAGAQDLLGLGLLSTPQQQPLPQLPPSASTGPAGKAVGAGPVAMRGGQPAKGCSALVDDPFKDLLG